MFLRLSVVCFFLFFVCFVLFVVCVLLLFVVCCLMFVRLFVFVRRWWWRRAKTDACVSEICVGSPGSMRAGDAASPRLRAGEY